MTQEELEGNKLIAKYIGATKREQGSFELYNFPEKTKEGFKSYDVIYLEFHCSMDWLYPVYQKIVKWHEKGNNDKLDIYSKTLLNSKYLDCILKVSGGESVSEIFKKIVEWIKIYNLKVLENDKT
jgi:hypothetical protein